MQRHLANIRNRHQAKNTPGLFCRIRDGYPDGFGDHLCLTKREKEVFQLILSGHTSQEVGQKLKITYSTAKRHRENILVKNNCYTVRELMALCFDKQNTPAE